MKFGGYFPYLNDRDLRSLHLNFGGGDDDDNDSDSGGTTLDFTGGAGQPSSSFNEAVFSGDEDRPLSAAEQAGAKAAGVIGSAIAGPLGGIAGSKGTEAIIRSSTQPSGFGSGTLPSIGGDNNASQYSGGSGDNNAANISGSVANQSTSSSNQYSTSGGTVANDGSITSAVQAELDANARAQDFLESSYADSRGDLLPYQQAGEAALTQQQALTGLSGVDAQQQAYDDFIESPAQAFIRKQQQKTLLAGASATGQLGGGNVQKALVDYGTGVAAQQQDTLYNQLAGISGTGQVAASNQATTATTFGANAANLAQSAGESRSSGILAQQALAQQQATADSQADALKSQQNTALLGAVAPAAFDFISGWF